MKHGKSKFFMLLVLDILVLQCAVCTYMYLIVLRRLKNLYQLKISKDSERKIISIIAKQTNRKGKLSDKKSVI